MPTFMLLDTKHVSLLLAIILIAKSIFNITFKLLNNIFAIFTSNLFQIVLILLTSKSNMIGLNLARRTKDLLTSFFWTPDSKLSLVFSSISWELLPELIFFIVVYISCLNLPNIPTDADNDSWDIWKFNLCLDPIEFFPHNRPNFNCADLLVTELKRTVDLSMLWIVLSSDFSDAVMTDDMSTLFED